MALLDMTAADIVFSILITVYVYLLIPIIVILIFKKRTTRFINITSIISMIVGMLLMGVLIFWLTDGTGSVTGGGALLWTFVGNWLMRKKLAYKEKPIEVKPESEKILPLHSYSKEYLEKILLADEDIRFECHTNISILPVSDGPVIFENTIPGIFVVTNKRLIFVRDSLEKFIKFLRLENLVSIDNQMSSSGNVLLKLSGMNHMFVFELSEEENVQIRQILYNLTDELQ